jgi:cobalt-zinc-cadmium efflux system protein
VALYILYEAYDRLTRPYEIQSVGMLVVACIGFVVNLASMRVLSGGKDSSLNLKGAYLEVWSDLLGSIGVIGGALIIHFTGWQWVDSLIAVAIGLWVLPRTWVLLKDSLNILLEGVPEGIDVDAVAAAIRQTPGVASLHDLHVWAITIGQPSLSVHVVAPTADYEQDLLPALRHMLAEKFGLRHITVQCEREPCPDADDLH